MQINKNPIIYINWFVLAVISLFVIFIAISIVKVSDFKRSLTLWIVRSQNDFLNKRIQFNEKIINYANKTTQWP